MFPVIYMRIKAVYRDEVLKPLQKLNLPEKTKVRIIIKGSFSELLDELGEMEAKEDINKVLEGMRMRNYYG